MPAMWERIASLRGEVLRRDATIPGEASGLLACVLRKTLDHSEKRSAFRLGSNLLKKHPCEHIAMGSGPAMAAPFDNLCIRKGKLV